MHELTIADTAIREDAEGRYCLNLFSSVDARHTCRNRGVMRV